MTPPRESRRRRPASRCATSPTPDRLLEPRQRCCRDRRRGRRDRARAPASPAPLFAAMLEAGSLRMLLPRSLDGGETDPPDLRAGDRGDRQGRRQHRLVPLPDLGLRDGGGLPAAGKRAEIFGRDPERRPRLGPRPQPRRRRDRGRLPPDRQLVLCQRRPACDLARRPLPGLRGRRHAAARRPRARRWCARCCFRRPRRR